jgi:hypothetical protein
MQQTFALNFEDEKLAVFLFQRVPAHAASVHPIDDGLSLGLFYRHRHRPASALKLAISALTVPTFQARERRPNNTPARMRPEAKPLHQLLRHRGTTR